MKTEQVTFKDLWQLIKEVKRDSEGYFVPNSPELDLGGYRYHIYENRCQFNVELNNRVIGNLIFSGEDGTVWFVYVSMAGVADYSSDGQYRIPMAIRICDEEIDWNSPYSSDGKLIREGILRLVELTDRSVPKVIEPIGNEATFSDFLDLARQLNEGNVSLPGDAYIVGQTDLRSNDNSDDRLIIELENSTETGIENIMVKSIAAGQVYRTLIARFTFDTKRGQVTMYRISDKRYNREKRQFRRIDDRLLGQVWEYSFGTRYGRLIDRMMHELFSLDDRFLKSYRGIKLESTGACTFDDLFMFTRLKLTGIQYDHCTSDSKWTMEIPDSGQTINLIYFRDDGDMRYFTIIFSRNLMTGGLSVKLVDPELRSMSMEGSAELRVPNRYDWEKALSYSGLGEYLEKVVSRYLSVVNR